MGDSRKRESGAGDASGTDTEEVRPDLVESVPIRHGMVLAGRYAIEQIIGRGGSGVVVRAHDRDLRQEVAIKIVRAELVGQRVWATRLAREVKLARQIQHPHVCRVFDFEQSDGRAFLVMELAAKGSLRDELRSGAVAARPLAERIADARAVASALSAIHVAGIVHRDVTPQNMLRMGDGRLVLSDFGLATDASESTSIHGGTVAYMAPEVLRGGKASVASDIWALGVVMHEMVFGVKPRWPGAADAAEMLAPELGRKLTEEERAVLDACRACTAKEPGRRVANADAAGRLITERRVWWARVRVSRRPLVVTGAFVLAIAGVVAAIRTPHPQHGTPTASASESPLLVPTGEPAEWTDVSTVIAEVPGRIHCTRPLPDQRTIRFVWGTPPHAEDVNTVTRKRVPSLLVPAAYAEGCPDLSADGKRLVYQGHVPDGRAFAFLSRSPDGTDAVPVVPTAEPSMSSEPTWLDDNDTISFDIDSKHMGAFSAAQGRMKVLPELTPKPFVTAFRHVISSRIYVSTVFETGDVEFSEISMPEMRVGATFRVPGPALDLESSGGLLYYSSNRGGRSGELVQVDVSTHEARRLGKLTGRFIRYPVFQSGALAFVGLDLTTTVVVGGPEGASHRWTTKDKLLSAAPCGGEIVAATYDDGGTAIKRFEPDGRFVGIVTKGRWYTDPACSSDGRVLFYLRQGDRPGVVRCDGIGCRTIADRQGVNLVASPDGKRLALVTTDDRRGAIVEIIDARGGGSRKLIETETACRPGWTSNDTLWVSRRRGAKIVWTEVNADSGGETGRSVPGARECSDGKPDPLSPAQPEVRVVFEQTSQLRLLSREHLRQ
jgi:serine/threonine protein kinase